jgi:hypothetical protein
MNRLALLVVVAVQYGCAGSQADRCERDEDCPSGFCRADLTCAPEGEDAAVEGDAGEHPDADVGGCDPDLDGTITRDELPLAPGRVATYRVALDATVSTAGTQLPDGKRAWDVSGALAGDANDEITLIDPVGQWWSTTFPGASYAAPLSAEADLLGVFELSETRLRLLGVVSPTAGNTRTELTYDPPVDVLVLPLTPSSAWEVDSTVSGLAQGIAAFYSERYESRVDALGTIDTPYGEFPVSRVAVDLTRTVGAAITTKRQFAFVSECYSTVATIVSQDYEQDAEFTDAAEVRRLTP